MLTAEISFSQRPKNLAQEIIQGKVSLDELTQAAFEQIDQIALRKNPLINKEFSFIDCTYHEVLDILEEKGYEVEQYRDKFQQRIDSYSGRQELNAEIETQTQESLRKVREKSPRITNHYKLGKRKNE
jgi:hypothetical protein